MSSEETVDVTPTFNYQRHVEIVRRFLERLTWHANRVSLSDPHMGKEEPTEWGMADFVAETLKYVRPAMSEIMADDIRYQIAEKLFPIRYPEIAWHTYVPYAPAEDWHHDRPIPCEECDALPSALQHVLA